jgi:hypothetical protein
MKRGGGTMRTTRRHLLQVAATVPLAMAAGGASTAAAQAANTGASSDPSSFLLTVFLRHDETKTLDEINQHLRQTGYYKQFPPAGIEIVSWYVVMGIGQVVTLKVPPARLREVNRVLEQTAWGGYRTEFYPTYDYLATAQEERKGSQ